jgi:hypothetical protein
MRNLIKLRLFLAGVLLILGTLATHAKEVNEKYELLKKAKYFEIRAELTAGDITLEEAQRKWQKALRKLNKEEGK